MYIQKKIQVGTGIALLVYTLPVLAHPTNIYFKDVSQRLPADAVNPAATDPLGLLLKDFEGGAGFGNFSCPRNRGF